MDLIKLHSIYLSKGHNFKGHHGHAASENPSDSVKEVTCVAGKGLEGDRFFGHKDDFKGQVTFFAIEVFRALSHHLNIHDKAPHVLRRNIITEGVDLNTLINKRFMIQGVEFEGTEECAPCHWMDQVFAEGTTLYLKGQGGLRARILADGVLRVDGGV